MDKIIAGPVLKETGFARIMYHVLNSSVLIIPTGGPAAERGPEIVKHVTVKCKEPARLKG
jgi:hypothetical protein